MKKFFWTLLVLILLLGVGFVYLIKNPETPISQKILTTIGIDLTARSGKQKAIDPSCTSYFDGCNTCMVSGGVIGGCTRMYCETMAEPKCLEYVNTGIDLTNCVSYFDGCNNCTVKDGKPEACTLMYCETPAQPKCTQYASGTENAGTAGLANPASTNCVDHGGKLEIKTQSDGGQVGMCTLSNGTVCEERAYMRGECGTKSENQTTPSSESTPAEEPTMCNMEYAPVCASVQVECIKAPCNPIEETFGNTCMMKANKHATYLHDGECKE